MTTKGYVYAVVAPGPRLVKIGKAINVRGRLSALQCGSPVPLGLHSVSLHEDCVLAERQTHVMLAHARQHGEWFDMRIVEVDRWLASREFPEFELPELEYVEPPPKPTLIEHVVHALHR